MVVACVSCCGVCAVLVDGVLTQSGAPFLCSNCLQTQRDSRSSTLPALVRSLAGVLYKLTDVLRYPLTCVCMCLASEQ